MRGCTRAGKSVLSRLLAADGSFAYLEMDAYKRQKYGSAWMCNPNVDFPAMGKLAKTYLRDGKRVIVEESFVEKAHVAAVVRWAGFELDDVRVAYAWIELSFEEAVLRKPDSKFPIERLRAEYARYSTRWEAPDELIIHTAGLSESAAVTRIREHLNQYSSFN
ncbi:MAG: hypothetical protein EAZ30_15900 [Betaproteobacteria bacterium]|nr:MAG: hypothetical protein EAZ30_15900 [Betaproteobacteria bacterium]